jgi:hypothetical protein
MFSACGGCQMSVPMSAPLAFALSLFSFFFSFALMRLLCSISYDLAHCQCCTCDLKLVHAVILHSPVLRWQDERRIDAPSCRADRKRVHGTASSTHRTKPSFAPSNIGRILNATAVLLDVDGIDVRLASLNSDFLHVALRVRGLEMNEDVRRKQR